MVLVTITRETLNWKLVVANKSSRMFPVEQLVCLLVLEDLRRAASCVAINDGDSA